MIELSDSAVAHIKRFLAQDSGAVGLRFGITRSGCSGYAYVVDAARERHEEDTAFEVDGITVLVDADSLSAVDGTRIDFVEQGLNRVFTFENPNVSDACGCGESFAVGA